MIKITAHLKSRCISLFKYLLGSGCSQWVCLAAMYGVVLIVVWRDTQCTENERIDEKQSLD